MRIRIYEQDQTIFLVTLIKQRRYLVDICDETKAAMVGTSPWTGWPDIAWMEVSLTVGGNPNFDERADWSTGNRPPPLIIDNFRVCNCFDQFGHQIFDARTFRFYVSDFARETPLNTVC